MFFIGDVEEDQSEKEWLETNLKLIVMGVIDPTIFIDALFGKFLLIQNRELNKNLRSYKILNKQDQAHFTLETETGI